MEGDLVWMAYIEGFVNDPVFRDPESSVHNCNCCKSFIRRYGNLVAINHETLELVSLWDFEPSQEEYRPSVKAMRELIHSAKVQELFVETWNYLSDMKSASHEENESLRRKGAGWYRLGYATTVKRWTFEDIARWPNAGQKVNEVTSFNHINLEIPKELIYEGAESKGALIGKAAAHFGTFKRAMTEITPETYQLVIDLEAQGSLLNGTSYMRSVKEALKAAEEFRNIPADKQDNWCWLESMARPGVSGIRNTAIGSLMVDIEDGKNLNEAVKSFNYKVDPANYMKASAPITKRQIEEAEKFVEENGYTESLDRRCATMQDISVSEILHSGSQEVKTKISIFDQIKPTAKSPEKIGKDFFKGAEEMSIDDFMKNVLPGAVNLEVWLSSKHKKNFVTLLTANNPKSKPLFKWKGNNFSWTYNGGLAGVSQITQAVKAAGGFVDAPFRCSLRWNTDGRASSCDLDLHVQEAQGEHIYFGSSARKPGFSRQHGQLDIDITRPGNDVAVENIYWDDLNKLKDGIYRVWVNNYNRGRNTGFDAEIFFQGDTYTYLVPQEVMGDTEIAKIHMKGGQIEKIDHSKWLTNQDIKKEDIYGLSTGEFQEVNLMCVSPNYWGNEAVGNKHYFMFLKGAMADDDLRTIHNEYLNQELLEHRKVLDALGAKLKCPSVKGQLSGLGFNATVRDEVIVRVDRRVIKIKF